MSYDIYFVKSEKLDAANIEEFLESEASDSDEHFISKALMNEVKEALADKGLSFDTFEGKEDQYIELNFETYQVTMFNSQIAVSLPCWDVNSSGAIDQEVKQISKVLIERGFIGYDPQTGKLFTEPTAFSTDFGQVNKRVNDYFSPKVNSEKTWRPMKLGVIFVLFFLLVKFLVFLFSKLF